MFGIDWTGDGNVNFIDDLISMEVMGLLDDEEEENEDEDEDLNEDEAFEEDEDI